VSRVPELAAAGGAGVAVIAPGIVLLNGSTLVNHDDAERIAEACGEQLLDACDRYSRARVALSFAAGPDQLPAGVPIALIADDAEEPGALAWHTEDEHGAIILRIGAKTCLDAGGGILAGGPSVSSAVSHELLETLIDPFVNEWVDMGDGKRAVAKEVCDPVQDGTYTIAGVDVSNYVLPAWWNPRAEGEKFDRLGVLSAPFTRTEGGYMVLRRGGSTYQEGMRAPWRSTAGRGARRLGQHPNALDEDTLGALLEQARADGPAVAQVVHDVLGRLRKSRKGRGRRAA